MVTERGLSHIRVEPAHFGVALPALEVLVMTVRVLLWSAAALLAAVPVAAEAADAPGYNTAASATASGVAPANFDWSGPYVGVNAGYGVGDFHYFTPGPATGAKPDGGGGIAGLQAGYNYQTGSIVLGVEGDLQASGIDGTSGNASGAPGGGDTKASLGWFSTLRGRVGYAFDNIMVYGTGGAAVGEVKGKITGEGPGTGKDSGTAWGYTVGAGIEAALTEHLTAKAEYLYVDLNKKNLDIGGVNQKVDADTHAFRLGLNYKF